MIECNIIIFSYNFCLQSVSFILIVAKCNDSSTLYFFNIWKIVAKDYKVYCDNSNSDLPTTLVCIYE